jgi:hypothetical protein
MITASCWPRRPAGCMQATAWCQYCSTQHCCDTQGLQHVDCSLLPARHLKANNVIGPAARDPYM